MAIRFANLSDIPSLVEGGRRMHALTRFSCFQYDASKVARTFAEIIESDGGRYSFFIAEGREKKIVGALIGAMEQPIFSSQYVASIVHIDVLPEARMGGYGVRLLKAFEQWASNRNAMEINFGINSGIGLPSAARFAVRMGYRNTGGNFVKSGQHGERVAVPKCKAITPLGEARAASLQQDAQDPM